MITYKNVYYAGGKMYADIIAKMNDKIFVDDLGNGSTLRVIDGDVDDFFYFDQERGEFVKGGTGANRRVAYLTVLPTTTFTIENTGGTNRQRFADVRYFAENEVYYFEIKMGDDHPTIDVQGEKDESGNMVFTLQNVGQIVANVAESQAYGEPGLYIVSPMLDMMAGTELSIKIYVDALGNMDKYGH